VLDEDAELEGEVVDGVVVGAGEAHDVIAGGPSWLPSVRPKPAAVAALAATGFVAGVTTAAVVTHRRRVRRGAPRRPGRRQLGEIVSTNSFLIDIHLLRRD